MATPLPDLSSAKALFDAGLKIVPLIKNSKAPAGKNWNKKFTTQFDTTLTGYGLPLKANNRASIDPDHVEYSRIGLKALGFDLDALMAAGVGSLSTRPNSGGRSMFLDAKNLRWIKFAGKTDTGDSLVALELRANSANLQDVIPGLVYLDKEGNLQQQTYANGKTYIDAPELPAAFKTWWERLSTDTEFYRAQSNIFWTAVSIETGLDFNSHLIFETHDGAKKQLAFPDTPSWIRAKFNGDSDRAVTDIFDKLGFIEGSDDDDAGYSHPNSTSGRVGLKKVPNTTGLWSNFHAGLDLPTEFDAWVAHVCLEHAGNLDAAITAFKQTPNSSAAADFDDGLTEILVEANPERYTSPWASRIVELDETLKAPNFLIQGFLDDKLTVIAGSPAVGKTSCLVPLATVVAGFIPADSFMEVETPRHVFYVTEDPAQLQRILYGIVKHTVLSGGESINFDRLKERFHVIATKRSTPEELADLAKFVRGFITKYELDNGALEVRPLVVFDTSAAAFKMKEENSNSEASAFIGAIKDRFCEQGIPVWVVTHIPKALRRADVEDMTIRGASAFEGDANATAFLFEEDGIPARFMKLAKRRFEADYEEIQISSTVHFAPALTVTGKTIDLKYRFSTIEQCSKELRVEARDAVKEMQVEIKNQNLQQRILEVIPTLTHPSSRDTYALLKGKKSSFDKALSELKEQGKVLELHVDEHTVLPGNRKTYLAISRDTLS